MPTAVTVRDGEGRLVRSLQREDFTVTESGIEQPITQFTRERVPVNLALMLDVSDSMRGPRMDDARLALNTFLEDLLKPEDEAALLVFNHATRVLSNWTTDRELLPRLGRHAADRWDGHLRCGRHRNPVVHGIGAIPARPSCLSPTAPIRPAIRPSSS